MILVVDDEAESRTLLTSIRSVDAYPVRTARVTTRILLPVRLNGAVICSFHHRLWGARHTPRHFLNL